MPYLYDIKMLKSKKILEKFLQRQRFKRVLPFLNKEVLDFGGNEGELKQFVKGHYTLVNYDYSTLQTGKVYFDTIVSLAVIEHMPVGQVQAVFKLFKSVLMPNGVIVLTTPTPKSKWVLECLATLGLLDKVNIAEHQHYWTKEELIALAKASGFAVKKYYKFQLGYNQFMQLEHLNS